MSEGQETGNLFGVALVVYPVGQSIDQSLFTGIIVYSYEVLGGIISNSVLIFAFGYPIRVPNFSLIEACISKVVFAKKKK